jgi:Tol biopolymer transport system component
MINRLTSLIAAFALVMLLAPSPISAQGCIQTGTITRVSVSSGGAQANSASVAPDLSGDGRYVAFSSMANNLVANDTNSAEDVFVYDRHNCQTQRVSVSTGGAQANSGAYMPRFSTDGRRLVFDSDASNLVTSDLLGFRDVFIRNVPNAQTERVSLTFTQLEPNGNSLNGAPNADGRFVAFESLASNLTSTTDSLGFSDIFVRDRLNSATSLISVSTSGAPGNGDSSWASISDDGRYVVFLSEASNLIPVDGNTHADIFIRDRQTNTTTRINGIGGGAPNERSFRPVISGDGRYIAFTSLASNLATGDSVDLFADVFLHDRHTAATIKISSGASAEGVDISGDGRLIVYSAMQQVYLFDRLTGQTALVSRNTLGAPGNGASGEPAISADGTTITFASAASDLIPNDTNNASDIFALPRYAVYNGNLLANGDFTAGFGAWNAFSAPSAGDIVYAVNGGVLEFYRQPGSESAVILQPTGYPAASGAGLDAQIDIGNASGVRKRVTLLIHDADFSDLQVCTFWLPPNAPMRTYRMTARTTEAWSNVTLSIYASSADGAAAYRIDNASLKLLLTPTSSRTLCFDPNAPPAAIQPDGSEWLANGDFSAGLTNWAQFFNINTQVVGGVLEFQGTGVPTGVVFQETNSAVSNGTIIEARFDIGSSAPRRRVTVLLRDADFSDLQVCTFWLPPNAALGQYVMRAYTTEAWTGASISFYPSTTGTNGWYRVDNVSFRSRPSLTIVGTECYPPGTAPADLGLPALSQDELLPALMPTVTPSGIEGALGEDSVTQPGWSAPAELPLLLTAVPDIPDVGNEGSVSE